MLEGAYGRVPVDLPPPLRSPGSCRRAGRTSSGRRRPGYFAGRTGRRAYSTERTFRLGKANLICRPSGQSLSDEENPWPTFRDAPLPPSAPPP
uniref:Uncharacterized protein n=1 Tax=Nonomuraea gerenzanensis TaxID=93944 RepID=A0A1M4EFA0_9ACTN|nr:hypothetical protein BN4615_P6864 [Nonomuraea gerenzanensis]